ncbi:DUF411 domain-containing protein [Diaphorobacter aerolatus]|uniref:DUF411 domain-containing protein n=1 Tax=Diaphorobacter aerolatus TaxID=1288495 RepID=A0A7H0GJJ7_9BURK|nr:DUF411 domain-containing protein [Diaphorobacter aerolatus]QNP48463.1 DUF411 domain-containing protein [Diaphorobacter aerolatus]
MQHPTSAFTRRQLLGGVAAALLAVPALPALANKPAKIAVEVWKDPSCGCCGDWIKHMEDNGFAVTVHDSGNTAARAKLGLPARLGSCHTALVGNYLIEGHVPAADVKKLLKERPKALGIAVPGMPVGSPGMDGPDYGGRKDPYDVLLVTRNLMNSDVSTRVFTSYR